MKQRILIVLFLLSGNLALNAQSANADAAKTVGPSGADYTTLKLAFDAINAGSITGDIILQVTGSITDNSSAVLNASSSGSANYTSVNIYPTVSGVTLSGSYSGPLINLNGADHVTIDGRVGGTGLTIDMTITNTRSGDGNSSTIQFNNDATYNTVKYCVIKGSASGGDKGILRFTNTATTTGNSNNTIDHNELTNSGGNRPLMVIFSNGASAAYNRSNTISNNNFHDVLNPGLGHSVIINLAAGNDNTDSYNSDWTITGNSFYDSEAYTYSGGSNMLIMFIYATNGNNFTISNNFIGGNSPLCGGTWTKSGGSNTFNLMEIRVGSSTASEIQGNTIKNINFTNGNNYIWWGINIQAGKVNVGTTAGNCYGASEGTGSITFTGNGSNSAFYAFHFQSSDVNAQNNIIGSITVTNTSSTSSTHFYGIYFRSNGGTCSVSNNTIGSITTSKSINAFSLSTTDAQKVCGIVSDGNSGTLNINNNTIANLINGTTNSTSSVQGKIYGIYVFKNTCTISGNIIRDLTIGNANNGTGPDPNDNTSLSAAGIAFASNSNSAQTLSGNTIYNISNSYASFTGHVAGIYYYGQSTSSSVSGNLIYDLSVNSGSSATIHGIKIAYGVATYSNNIITLGGSTSTTLYGIYEPGVANTTSNIYFNTVYLGGSPTTGSLNSACLYNAGTSSNRNFRNNIFNNARSNSGASGTHFAMYILNTGGSLNCNYNDYWFTGTGGKLGYYGGDKASLPIVTGVTGNDANSQSILPGFVNPGGTTANSYIPSAALPAATGTGIITDYRGTTRSGSPEMGAWEQSNSLTWNGSSSQDWSTAANWTPSMVPTASHNVLVTDQTNDPVVNESIGTPAMCNNLTIEAGATFAIAPGKALTVNGTFTNNAGNSGLVIESDATGTGSLIQSSASVGATIQRYINGSSDPSNASMYHFVSIPTYYSDPLSGLFLGSYLYTLDATQIDPTNYNYYGKWECLGSPTTTTLLMNTGYMIFYPEASHTYIFSGYLNTGTFSPAVSYGGTYTFNLVPNPYPSAINWGASGGWVKSNIGATAWIWNSSSGNYTTLSGNSYVPAGQAFIVMTSGTPVLTMDNNACVHNSQALYKSTQANTLKIKAQSNNFYDEAFVSLNSSATPAFDLDYDGFKLWGLSDAPQLWTEAGDGRLSINQLPPPSGSLIVPLDFKTSYSGEVTFSFSGMENIDPSMPIRLEDKLNGSVKDLRQSDKYIFSHDPSNTEKRFSLIFGYPDGISANGTNDGKVWIAGKSVFINPGDLKGMEGQLEIFNLLGQTLYSVSVNLDHLAIINPSLEGMVIVRLTAGGKSCTARGYIH